MSRPQALVRSPPTTKHDRIFAASAYWGEEAIWDSQANIHNPMFDEKGRVWRRQVRQHARVEPLGVESHPVRSDDPNAGWKGRGLWTTTGNRTPFHMEGGRGRLPKVVHFQIRPDALAN